ncbi:MAG TPA: endonuclease, partial [Saprospiraceae bacterium]|nr:endonuclease [Saprospiraceae bacterium]
MKIYLAFAIMLCSHCHGFCQLFPGLEGDELVQAIQNEYTPHILLNDTQVKDTLYAKVFIQNDTVRCIYSGLPRFLPAFEDPSQYLFGNGNETESINLEHGWPQAKGAGDGTNGSVDMHHLYPSRVKINSDRANYPFMNIDDNATNRWYYLGFEMASLPLNNIDAYSEFMTGSFEPKENVKGDIARAMFYFWTIYRDDAINADPDFFELQKEYLCEWHIQDPVDNFEMLRNERIAAYQDGKLNPFILDCSLAGRAYCSESEKCNTVSNQVLQKDLVRIDYDLMNNRFQVFSQNALNWEIKVFNILGQLVSSDFIEGNQWNNCPVFNSGIYVIVAISNKQS